MILFAPEYDDQTRACAPIADHIARSSGGAALLRESEATRGELLRELSKNDTQACLIFSHGSPDEICGQHGEMALVPKDFQALPDIPIFAYACHSALFGQRARQQESVWWGYDKTMVPPPLDVLKKDDVETIFRYIAHRFHTCATADQVRCLIEEIRDLSQRFVGKYWRNQKATMASAVFFMQLWTRLRVWIPESQTPIAHEQSWSGDLDDAI